MKNLFAVVLMLLAFVAPSSAAESHTIEMDVDGLVCAFCAQGIEKKLRKESATDDVYVNLENGLVAVALKPEQTLADDHLKALLTEAGYTVRAIRHSQTPLEKLKAGAK